MSASDFSVVTGAFGYTGKYITRRLLARGERVVTLTGHPNRPNPFDREIGIAPFHFDRPDQLAESLEGARTLYNTYWVRFPHRGMTYEKAIENVKTLFGAAKSAGVRRVVHVSIANPSLDSPLPYYSGKSELEEALIESGLSYAILRPTVIFGAEDVLINNIAWLIRRFPVFAVPGDGEYKLQPIYVEDMARLAVEVADREDNVVLDAVGPETYTFNQLAQLIMQKTGRRAWLVHLPPGLALHLSQIVGWLVGDTVLTRNEVRGLMANLLVSDQPPTGETRLSHWLEENAESIGANYHSELRRHYR